MHAAVGSSSPTPGPLPQSPKVHWAGQVASGRSAAGPATELATIIVARDEVCCHQQNFEILSNFRAAAGRG